MATDTKPAVTPPAVPSPAPYIRTYAKDLAQASGNPLPVSSLPPVVPVESKKESEVTLPEVDESPREIKGESVIKEFPQEQPVLAAKDSEGVFKGVQPPDLGSDREAILARLRAKVAASAPQPLPPPPTAAPIVHASIPEPRVPDPLPIRTAAPTFDTPVTLPVPPIPPVEKPAAPPTPAPAAESPSPLHTYTTDFADRIDEKKASTFSVLAAEKDAGPRAVSMTPKRNVVLPLIAGVVVLLVGVGGVYAAYQFTNRIPGAPIVAGVPSLIVADENKELQGTGSELLASLVQLSNEPLLANNVVVAYLTQASSTDATLRVPEPGATLIRALPLRAPDILLRNIAPISTVGVVHAGNESRVFFALQATSYERTFAGMLSWESVLPEVMKDIYPPYTEAPVEGTSTPAVLPSTPSTSFVDAVVANHDVRVLRDSRGRSRMLYGYKDRETLIIARDEDAFTLLINRVAPTAQAK